MNNIDNINKENSKFRSIQAHRTKSQVHICAYPSQTNTDHHDCKSRLLYIKQLCKRLTWALGRCQARNRFRELRLRDLQWLSLVWMGAGITKRCNLQRYCSRCWLTDRVKGLVLCLNIHTMMWLGPKLGVCNHRCLNRDEERRPLGRSAPYYSIVLYGMAWCCTEGKSYLMTPIDPLKLCVQ